MKLKLIVATIGTSFALALSGCGGSDQEKTVFSDENMSELSDSVTGKSYEAIQDQYETLDLSDFGGQLTGRFNSDCEDESAIEATCTISFEVDDGSALVQEYDVELREEDSCWDATTTEILYRVGEVASLDNIIEVDVSDGEVDLSGCLDAE